MPTEVDTFIENTNLVFYLNYWHLVNLIKEERKNVFLPRCFFSFVVYVLYLPFIKLKILFEWKLLVFYRLSYEKVLWSKKYNGPKNIKMYLRQDMMNKLAEELHCEIFFILCENFDRNCEWNPDQSSNNKTAHI